MDASMENLRQDVRKNPADLEREADHARDAVEDTLHELERQLSPSELAHRVIDTVKRSGGGFADDLFAHVRNNPLPALLAGAGVVWLALSLKRAEQPYVGNPSRESASETGNPPRSAMNATATAARTAAGSMRGAADAVTDAASRAASATGHTAEAIAQASRGGVQRVTERYSHLSREQPLVLGALAVVVGAAIGALLPSSDAEDEWLGNVSEEAKSRLKSEARSTADDLQAAAKSAAKTVQ